MQQKKSSRSMDLLASLIRSSGSPAREVGGSARVYTGQGGCTRSRVEGVMVDPYGKATTATNPEAANKVNPTKATKKGGDGAVPVSRGLRRAWQVGFNDDDKRHKKMETLLGHQRGQGRRSTAASSTPTRAWRLGHRRLEQARQGRWWWGAILARGGAGCLKQP